MFGLNSKIIKDLNKIYELLGEEFIFYGGGILDSLSSSKINDYDIAIKNSKGIKKKIISRLKKNKFEIFIKNRIYYIYINKKVSLIYAKKGKLNLDIAFIDNYDLIGQWDIESAYIIWPKNKEINLNLAKKAKKAKKICLIRNISQENPFLLLSRFLYLCAKYSFSINKKEHKKYISLLEKKCIKWNPPNIKFHKKEVEISFYSYCIKTLIKSNKKMIKNLYALKVYEKLFPELHLALSLILRNYQKFNKIKNKDKMVFYLDQLLNYNKKFRRKIQKLNIRNWDNYKLKFK